MNFDNVLQVEILDPKPNPLFTEWQTANTKFLRYSHAVACAECGKRSKTHWTQLSSFKAHTMDGTCMSLENSGSGRVYPPLAPVCRKHLLAVAESPAEAKLARKQEAR